MEYVLNDSTTLYLTKLQLKKSSLLNETSKHKDNKFSYKKKTFYELNCTLLKRVKTTYFFLFFITFV